MTRIITTVHLTNIQKEVLAKVKAAQNPHMAWEVIQQVSDSMDSNFAKARDTLGNLGILAVGDGEVEITDKGEELMTKENITDETGELSEFGNQLAGIDRSELPAPSNPQPNQQQPEDEMGDDFMSDPELDNIDDMEMDDLDNFGESFSLLRSLNTAATILEDQEKFKK